MRTCIALNFWDEPVIHYIEDGILVFEYYNEVDDCWYKVVNAGQSFKHFIRSKKNIGKLITVWSEA